MEKLTLLERGLVAEIEHGLECCCLELTSFSRLRRDSTIPLSVFSKIYGQRAATAAG